MQDFDQIYEETPESKELSDRGGTIGFVGLSELISKREPSVVEFAEESLASIQQNFHNLMYYRCRDSKNCIEWLNENKEFLPKIITELVNITKPEWFSVEGMYGGFAYALIDRDGEPVLITESWIRIAGGSGEQHEITPEKVKLVAKGFV